MMFTRFFLLTTIFTTILSAQCFYNLDVDFNFDKKTIQVDAKVKDETNPIKLNFRDFDIKNKKSFSNELTFSYEKQIEKLDKNYIYLLNGWYPNSNQRCTYFVTTNLNSSYKTIFEDTKKEIDKFTFIASKDFIVNSKKYNDIEVQTYFLRDDEELSLKFLDKTIEYIKLYEKMIGKYPYKKFKIVENVYQTGYSMPTFTLIGSRLLNKPYILNQSLGHELLHQYFGNSIFNDFSKGNWVEGLTTYLADDFYKKQEGTDREQRKVVLTEYENFVNKKNEFEVKDFVYKKDKASSLIGYSKLSFVFHMLQKKIGQEKFEELIKKLYKEYKFKELNLQGLANFFDTNTKEDLKNFFYQWLDRKGMLDFKVENLDSYYDKDGFNLEFEIVQDKKKFYEFDLPVVVETYDKRIEKVVAISKAKQKVKLSFESEVLNVTFDNNIDLFRKLSQKEKLISISSLMVEKDLIAIVNKEQEEKYKLIKRIFPKAKLVFSNKIKFKDIKDNSVIFLDFDNELLNSFYPNVKVDKSSTYLEVKKHIYNPQKSMTILNIGEFKAMYLMFLKHYSSYKEVIFTKDEVIKKRDKTANGIKFVINTIPTFAKVEKHRTIKELVDQIKDKRVIYVGESHDNFRHHLNQLRVIKALHESGKEVAIAMEMFQKPFQKYLDAYVQGEIDLDEFLQKTEYFKRWKFDYNLYKPILDYARKNRIKVLAINISRDITKQVSKKGLFSLSSEQKKLAPKQIDQSNLAYKRLLENIFKQHDKVPKMPKAHAKMMPKIDTNLFYQSQLIWDEIMAENIDEYLKTNPNSTVVVVAGAGHIEKHNGIPSRVYRRNGLPYEVVLNDMHKIVEGDILIFNDDKTTLLEPKKLGVYLKNDNELVVTKLVDDSLAGKLKIKEKDLLLEIDGIKVKNIQDVKRALYLVKDFKKLSVKVKRDKKQKVLRVK